MHTGKEGMSKKENKEELREAGGQGKERAPAETERMPQICEEKGRAGGGAFHIKERTQLRGDGIRRGQKGE